MPVTALPAPVLQVVHGLARKVLRMHSIVCGQRCPESNHSSATFVIEKELLMVLTVLAITLAGAQYLQGALNPGHKRSTQK